MRGLRASQNVSPQTNVAEPVVRLEMREPGPIAHEPAPTRLVVELSAPTAATIDEGLASLREHGVSVRRRSLRAAT